MRFRYAVSFEHPTRPVYTVRGEFEKEDAESACKSAAFLAFKQQPKGHYASVVITIEELESA